MVDLLAKDAVKLGHTQMSVQQLEETDDLVKVGQKVLRTIMATLKCFPKSEKLTRAKDDRPLNERVRRPKSRATEEKNRSHVWKWMYNKWGCVKCLTVTDCCGEDDEPPCWEPCQPGHVSLTWREH